jgi:hypothetical protein
MQLSNSLELYQSAFGKSPIVLKNSNEDSTQQDVESKKSNSNTLNSNSDNKSSKVGIPLDGATDLSYKFKYEKMNQADIEALGIPKVLAHMQSHSSSGGSAQEIKQFEDYWSDKANDQDAKIIIRIPNKDGEMEVMGIVDYNGAMTSKSSLTEIMNQSGGDLDRLNSLLSDKYGGDFSIESFEQGKGPTVAEVHQLFNGTSLNAYINNEIQDREQSYKAELQRTDEAQKQKLMYNQTSQIAVFSVGDTVVGSINEKGYVEINNNILGQADANNIDRESLKNFYSYDQMSNSDIGTVTEMLRNVFGDDVNVDSFANGNRPTLEDVRSNSKATLLPL